MKKISDYELVAEIKSGSSDAKSRMYLQYRDECLAWIHKNFSGIDRERACDVYMDACVSVWDKISDGKYELRSGVSFKTYLFSVVKNSILNILRGDGKRRRLPMTDQLPDDLIDEREDMDVTRKKQKIVRDTIFNIVGDPCRSIFRYRYYEKMSCEDIAVKMAYSGPRSVITQSSRCHKELRLLLHGIFRKSGLL